MGAPRRPHTPCVENRLERPAVRPGAHDPPASGVDRGDQVSHGRVGGERADQHLAFRSHLAHARVAAELRRPLRGASLEHQLDAFGNREPRFQLRDRSARGDFSAREQGDVAVERLDLGEVVAREQRRAARGGVLAQHRAQHAQRGEIDAARRLVEQQHARRVEHRPAERELLAHAGRVFAERRVAELDSREQRVDSFSRLRRRESLQRGEELQVLPPREAPVERSLVGGHQAAEPPRLQRVAGRVDGADLHAPRVGQDQRAEHLQQRGLACAVRAHQREQPSPRHVEIDAVEGGDFASRERMPDGLAKRTRADERLPQGADLESGLGHRSMKYHGSAAASSSDS